MSNARLDNFIDDLMVVCTKYYGKTADESCLWFENDSDSLFITIALPPLTEETEEK